jgi:hypothetical protein
VTGTGTSSPARRRRRATWLAATLVVLAAGALAAVLANGSPTRHAAGAFGWLRPAAAPSGWRSATTASGADLAYPGTWRRIHGDAGTVSAAPVGPNGVFSGYLNATPKAGDETLANWSRFRLGHLGEDGDHGVKLIAATTGLRFRGGHGSCVIDSYSTPATRFREIACIVAGRRRTSVLVAAAPEARWNAQAAVLERAVSTFSA